MLVSPTLYIIASDGEIVTQWIDKFRGYYKGPNA